MNLMGLHQGLLEFLLDQIDLECIHEAVRVVNTSSLNLFSPIEHGHGVSWVEGLVVLHSYHTCLYTRLERLQCDGIESEKESKRWIETVLPFRWWGDASRSSPSGSCCTSTPSGTARGSTDDPGPRSCPSLLGFCHSFAVRRPSTTPRR